MESVAYSTVYNYKICLELRNSGFCFFASVFRCWHRQHPVLFYLCVKVSEWVRKWLCMTPVLTDGKAHTQPWSQRWYSLNPQRNWGKFQNTLKKCVSTVGELLLFQRKVNSGETQKQTHLIFILFVLFLFNTLEWFWYIMRNKTYSYYSF